MITSLKQDTKKSSTLLKSDLNKFLVDKNKIKENPTHIWFKGSRFR
tara:strand:- start:119 stop:256 length:138 start_codon:yes stop_codon:yes gene_type:complete